MERYILLAVSVVCAVWYWTKARTGKDPFQYVLIAFWGLLGVNQFVRSRLLTVATVLCLALYWGLVLFRRRVRRDQLRELQNLTGFSERKILEIGQEARKDSERRKQEQKQEEEKKRLASKQEEAYRARARGGRFEVEIVVKEERSFGLEGGGRLMAGAGPVSIGVEMEPHDWGDSVKGFRGRTFVCDREGTEWKCETLGLARTWLDALDKPEGMTFTKWDNAPEAWRRAMKEQCLLAELTDLLDSREYHELEIEGRKYAYLEKYQMPTVDVAWLAAEKRWLVRVKGIFRDVHEDPPAPEGEENIPAFAWTVAVETGLLLAEPGKHVCNPDDIWEEAEDRSAEPTFQKTGREGGQQGSVVVQSMTPS